MPLVEFLIRFWDVLREHRTATDFSREEVLRLILECGVRPARVRPTTALARQSSKHSAAGAFETWEAEILNQISDLEKPEYSVGEQNGRYADWNNQVTPLYLEQASLPRVDEAEMERLSWEMLWRFLIDGKSYE